GPTEGRSSRYLFKDSGAQSSPTITNIVVNASAAKNEAWKLTSHGDGTYEVLGTRSGLQTHLAKEGSLYTTDGGEVQFFISSGGAKTTESDEFFFSTLIANPHAL